MLGNGAGGSFDSMKYKTLAVVLVAFIGGAIAATLLRVPAARAAQGQKDLDGFRIGEVRFDESVGGRQATPQIPKAWKFMGAGPGSAINGCTLWFQGADGSMYVLKGFTDNETFILRSSVQKLAVGG